MFKAKNSKFSVISMLDFGNLFVTPFTNISNIFYYIYYLGSGYHCNLEIFKYFHDQDLKNKIIVWWLTSDIN